MKSLRIFLLIFFSTFSFVQVFAQTILDNRIVNIASASERDVKVFLKRHEVGDYFGHYCDFSGLNYYSLWKSDKTKNIVETLPVPCLKKFIKESTDSFKGLSLPKSCSVVSKNKVCRHYQLKISPYLRWIEGLNDSIYFPKLGLDNSLFCSVNTNNIVDIIEASEKSLENYYCSEIKKGESRAFNSSQLSKARVSIRGGDYRLNRVSPTEYRVDIPIDFDASDILKKHQDEVDVKMKNRIKKCFSLMKPGFRGPDGKVLHINIVDKVENLEPSKVKISYNDQIIRANDENWKLIQRCSVTIHETLHLLGLSDEYEEHDSRFGYKYVKIDGDRVRLTESDYERNKLLKNVKSYESASMGDCRLSRDSSIMTDQAEKIKTSIFGTEKEDKTLFETTGEPKKEIKVKSSFLNKDHWNSLIYRGCNKKNKTYNLCTSFAYKTSILQTNNKCPEIPKECVEAGWKR